MRHYFSIVFLVLYMLALFRPAYPLLEYYVQWKEYQEKCINKAKPEMHCNGKCILMQKLKALQSESQEPTAPAPAKVSMEDYPLGFMFSDSHPISQPDSFITSQSFFYHPPLTSGYTSEIFHPPSLLG